MILSLRCRISSGQERDGFQFTAEVRHLYILIIFVEMHTTEHHSFFNYEINVHFASWIL